MFGLLFKEKRYVPSRLGFHNTVCTFTNILELGSVCFSEHIRFATTAEFGGPRLKHPSCFQMFTHESFSYSFSQKNFSPLPFTNMRSWHWRIKVFVGFQVHFQTDHRSEKSYLASNFFVCQILFFFIDHSYPEAPSPRTECSRWGSCYLFVRRFVRSCAHFCSLILVTVHIICASTTFVRQLSFVGQGISPFWPLWLLISESLI